MLLKLQRAVRENVQLCCPPTRHDGRPVTHPLLTDPQDATDRGLATVMFNCIRLEHAAAKYPIGDHQVNDGRPPFDRSYRAMEETKGQRIRRLREARGLTQPALARLLISMGAPATLSKAAVGKWESDDTKNISNETFILLAKALGTDPEYILWGQSRTPPIPSRSPMPTRTTKR